MEHGDAEAHFLSHYYWEIALISKGFTGLTPPKTISVFFTRMVEVSGCGWVIVPETERCVFLAHFKKGFLTVKTVKSRLIFIFFHIFVNVLVNHCERN